MKSEFDSIDKLPRVTEWLSSDVNAASPGKKVQIAFDRGPLHDSSIGTDSNRKLQRCGNHFSPEKNIPPWIQRASSHAVRLFAP